LSESQPYRSLGVYLIHFPENENRIAKFQVIIPTSQLFYRTIEELSKQVNIANGFNIQDDK
jgi:hypothetical protein